jgi:tetratricopeptide (TPR) repeat protein
VASPLTPTSPSPGSHQSTLQLAARWLELGNSERELFQNGNLEPAKRKHLHKAVDAYQRLLEVEANHLGGDAAVRILRVRALRALVEIYTDEPLRDFAAATRYSRQIAEGRPEDTNCLVLGASVFVAFGRVDDAEAAYLSIVQQRPQDPLACDALADFYNRPLWSGRSRFDHAVATLERCAALAPNDPERWRKVATFYWDKAYRDPAISSDGKDWYASRGLEAVEKALRLKPDGADAMVYKNLLYRVKASSAKDPHTRTEYLKRAEETLQEALALKREETSQPSMLPDRSSSVSGTSPCSSIPVRAPPPPPPPQPPSSKLSAP